MALLIQVRVARTIAIRQIKSAQAPFCINTKTRGDKYYIQLVRKATDNDRKNYCNNSYFNSSFHSPS